MKNKQEFVSFHFADLRAREISGADLAHADLTQAVLSRCALKNLTAASSIFIRCDLSHSKVENCEFATAVQVHAVFRGARVENTDFRGASAAGAQLTEGEFRSCSFRNADLAGANLDFARFENCDFYGARLTGASAVGAKFSGCDLRKADLAGADLSDADLAKVRLTGAHLTHADFNHASAKEVDFQSADVSNARFWMCSGLDASQKQALGKNGASLRSPMTEKVVAVRNFVMSNRPAQAALAAIILLVVVQVTRRFVDPSVMSPARLIRAAWQATEEGDHQKANEFLENALEKTPDSNESQKNEIRRHLMSNAKVSGDFAKAAAMGDQILASSSDEETRDSTLLELADIDLQSGNVAMAESRYSKLIESGAEDIQFHAKLGLVAVMAKKGRLAESLKIGDEILREVGNRPGFAARVHQELADICMEAGRDSEALGHLSAIIQKAEKPEQKAYAQERLLEIKVKGQTPAEALKTYEAAFSEADTPVGRGWMLLKMAEVYRAQGDFTKSRELSKKAESVGAADLTLAARFQLAQLSVDEGLPEQALDQFRNLRAEVSEPWRLDYVTSEMARLTIQLGRTTEARKLYEEIIAKPRTPAPALFEARLGMARILRQEGRAEEAVKEYKALVAQYGAQGTEDIIEGASAALQEMTELLAHSGRASEAREFLRSLIEKPVTEKFKNRARLILGHLFQIEGRLKDAAQLYEEVSKTSDEEGSRLRARMGLAGIDRQQGRLVEALERYQTLLSEHGDSSSIGFTTVVLEQIGTINAELKRWDDADRAFKDLLKKSGGSGPMTVRARIGLAELKAAQGDVAGAMADLQEMLREHEKERSTEWSLVTSEISLRMARMSIGLGRSDEAIQLYEDVLRKKYLPHPIRLEAQRALESLRQTPPVPPEGAGGAGGPPR